MTEINKQNDALYRKLFAQALRIRKIEEAIIDIYPSDKIQSPVHLSIGQEAIAVGLCHALEAEDKLFSTYRSHAFYLAKGGDLNAMMAELFGRQSGCCKGKGGSMHLAYPKVGFMGTSAIVASSISHAVGSALASKVMAKNNISIAVFGEGATEEGVYHESLNFAALKELPVLFVVENNGYAIHSAVSQRQSYQITQHAASYGIESHKLDISFDPLNLYNQFSPIVNNVRLNKKPCLIEVDTYRYMEHVGINHDYQNGYRDISELEHCEAIDDLVQNKALVEVLSPDIETEISTAIEFAETAGKPTLEDLLKDVH